MTEPVHSKASGRSGPKRKTGCSTCRRRKVRCDEARPSCQNCLRLRLDCGYVAPRVANLQQDLSAASETARNISQKGVHDTESSSSFGLNAPIDPTHGLSSDGHLWNHEISPFQDVFFSSLDNFEIGVDFAMSDAFLGLEYPNSSSNHVVAAPTGDKPRHAVGDNRRRTLIEHFVRSTNPISVILPTHTEWSSACRSLLAMANESNFVLMAICALSALHLYASKEEDSFEEAFQYYKTSSSEVNSMFSKPAVGDRQLKQAFATVFLLSHVELLAQTTADSKRNNWPLQHLQSAQHRVHQYSDRIRLWTGISKRLLTWTTLLQTKAEYNSGSAAFQHYSASLTNATGDPFERSSLNTAGSSTPTDPWTSVNTNSDGNTREATEEDARTVSEIAYDTMNQPGFDFFLKSSAFTSRVIGLDRYHRNRGTLETEFETLKEGRKVSKDLHALWATRPATITFLSDPNGLEEALQARVAHRILLNLRVYVANFFAQFIYLHRVAFKTYPATADVDTAVVRIVGLAKDIVNAANHTVSKPASGKAADSRPSGHANSHMLTETAHTVEPSETNLGLPATMLWPLFLAALEASIPDRLWLLQSMRAMDNQHVPNAARTVQLLEEVLRRQDKEGKRVDHRSVRKDLFEGDLSVLY